MKILAIESSACSASVAIVEDDKILSECYINTGLTHSQTIMPMVDATVKNSKIELKDIDFLAVANGPGSFTGVRIGVAAIKGLADAMECECIPVSTLEAMAYNVMGQDCIVLCCMDARCQQVYTATFDSTDNKIVRITEDEAVTIESLEQRLKEYKKNIVVVGDGAELVFKSLADKVPQLKLASANIRYQRASSVAFAAFNNQDKKQKGRDIIPAYLRLPQAERELKLKKEGKI